jgi:hypothetical protein
MRPQYKEKTMKLFNRIYDALTTPTTPPLTPAQTQSLKAARDRNVLLALEIDETRKTLRELKF